MKELPILFSGPMVRAILEGRKTQTRRIVRGQKRIAEDVTHFDPPSGLVGWGANDAAVIEHWPKMLRCPYGAHGDRLWVRETWAPRDDLGLRALYAADFDRASERGLWRLRGGSLRFGGDWRPSIHMPRKFSRISLEVVDVRVERLQAITNADARAEGVELCGPNCGDARGHFQALWDDINGTRGPFRANPWVWVVEFRRLGGDQ